MPAAFDEERGVRMQDLIYLVAIVAFFALAALFVVACDRIIGPDEAALEEETIGAPVEELPEKRAA
jgi:hypothetical protein